MGAGNFNIKKYKIQAEAAKVNNNSGFQAKSMCDEFNPANVSTRFSKKGPFNEFRDVITILIGLDVTGSMDVIPKELLKGELGNLMVDLKKEYNRPNENLQISFAGIGDAKSDSAPLQVTHFESDNRFAQQLQKIWLEGCGGANGAESYNLLWWYAANKTHLNYVEKDKRKGILITIGDDNVHPELTAGEIQMWLDPTYDGKNISNQVLLNAVHEEYHVYHIVVIDGYAHNYDYLNKADKTLKQKTAEAKQWTDLLGKDNVIQAKRHGVVSKIVEIVKRHRPIQNEKEKRLDEKEWKDHKINNLTDDQWVEVLNYTLCPLTRKFMQHPVVWDNNKRAYEKAALKSYVKEKQIDPITQKKIKGDLIFKPNLNIAQVCLNYKAYFTTLPEERQKKLIQMALPTPQIENKNSGLRHNNARAFFNLNDNNVLDEKKSSAEINKDADKNKKFECPITHEIMNHPVILIETGQTYEKEALEKWLQKHNTDPLTGKVLKNKSFIDNFALKSLCDDARKEQSPSPPPM